MLVGIGFIVLTAVTFPPLAFFLSLAVMPPIISIRFVARSTGLCSQMFISAVSLFHGYVFAFVILGTRSIQDHFFVGPVLLLIFLPLWFVACDIRTIETRLCKKDQPALTEP